MGRPKQDSDLLPGTNAERKVGELLGYLEVFIERKWQLAKLDVAEHSARFLSRCLSIGIVFSFGIIALLTFHLGAGFLLAESTGMSYGISFMLLFLLNIASIIIIYQLRHRLFTNPILGHLIHELFAKPNSSEN